MMNRALVVLLLLALATIPASLPAAGASSSELSYPQLSSVRMFRTVGTQFQINFATTAALELSNAELTEWVSQSAYAVANYFGRFPVTDASISILPTEGKGIKKGKALGAETPRITVLVGLATSKEDLNKDWIMTHEMVHFAFPSLNSENHCWLEEGIATYVEPIARARVGLLEEDDVWKEWITMMPEGLPKEGDRGLDHTHTWGRTYWGGALFCLLADIEIRKQTKNRHGLDDALRAIVASGGVINEEWDIDRVLAEGDKATGVPVLKRLYDKMKAQPVTVDLTKLWQQLGVEQRGDGIVYNMRAPLAKIRRAIVRPPEKSRP